MQILSSPLLLAFYIVCILLHALPPFFSPFLEKILRYANIVLHIALYALFLAFSVPMEECALLFLFSLLFYVVSQLLIEKIKAGKKASAIKDKEAIK